MWERSRAECVPRSLELLRARRSSKAARTYRRTAHPSHVDLVDVELRDFLDARMVGVVQLEHPHGIL